MAKNEAAAQLGRLGGKARAAALTPERRKEIATKASRATRHYRKAKRKGLPESPQEGP